MAEAKLLHPLAFKAEFGDLIPDIIAGYLGSALPRPRNTEQPDFTVAIQACNDTPEQIGRLFKDLDRQKYSGSIERLFINAEDTNSNETLDIAKSCGAKIITVPLDRHFRADMLNAGVKHADTNIVASLVGHSALMHDRWAQVVGHEASQPDFGGAFGIALPDLHASVWELKGAVMLGARAFIEDTLEDGGRKVMETGGRGFLAGDSSVVNVKLARELDGYPLNYGAGGADGALGKLMLKAGATVVKNLALANHHTHEFGAVKALLQLGAWASYAFPYDFNPRSPFVYYHNHAGL